MRKVRITIINIDFLSKMVYTVAYRKIYDRVKLCNLSLIWG